jgi:hypothetical protein
MSFQCPVCRSRSSLEISWSISLPPDSRSDEICQQVVECLSCGFRGLSVYEESRRGPLDAGHWEHTGYRASLSLVQTIETGIRSCKDPMNPHCPCTAHSALNRQDSQGYWVNPALDDQAESFEMVHFDEEKPE